MASNSCCNEVLMVAVFPDKRKCQVLTEEVSRLVNKFDEVY